MSPNERSNNNIETRIARLETTVDTIVHEVGSIKHGIENLSQDIHSSQKTPWSTLAAWAGVVITVITVVFGSIWHGQSKLYELQSQYLSQAVVSLDGNLQREMRDLDQVQIARLENLDKMLQREMDQKDAIIREQGINLLRRIEQAERWQHNRDNERPDDVVQPLSTLRAEVSSLIDEVDRLRKRLHAHETLEGHPAIEQKIDALKERMDIIEPLVYRIIETRFSKEDGHALRREITNSK